MRSCLQTTFLQVAAAKEPKEPNVELPIRQLHQLGHVVSLGVRPCAWWRRLLPKLMARPNRYDSLEKPKDGAKVKVKDEQDICFIGLFLLQAERPWNSMTPCLQRKSEQTKPYKTWRVWVWFWSYCVCVPHPSVQDYLAMWYQHGGCVE